MLGLPVDVALLFPLAYFSLPYWHGLSSYLSSKPKPQHSSSSSLSYYLPHHVTTSRQWSSRFLVWISLSPVSMLFGNGFVLQLQVGVCVFRRICVYGIHGKIGLFIRFWIWGMLCPQYFNNIFTTNQVISCYSYTHTQINLSIFHIC